VFWRIVLPLSLPGVAAGCFLVFILSIGSFITPALLGGLRDMFVAQLIEQLVNRLLDWNAAAAMAVALLGMTLGLAYVFERMLGIGKVWPK
jgi:ABC-type spermidine/putrescine transport system permease subunit I